MLLVGSFLRMTLLNFIPLETVHLSDELRYMGEEQGISSCKVFFFFFSWINRKWQGFLFVCFVCVFACFKCIFPVSISLLNFLELNLFAQ